MAFSSRYKRTRMVGFLAVLLSFAFILTACGGSDHSGTSKGKPSDARRTVTDAMGHKVKVPGAPKRILASYLEDPLVSLGVKPVAQWSVANGIQDYLQPELKGVPKISYDLPTEAVMSFNPDFIIIGSESQVQKGLYDQYSKIAPTYVLGDKVADDWRKTLLTIGDLLNKKKEAEQKLEDYDQKAKKAKADLQQKLGDQTVAILWLTQKQFYIVDKSKSSGAVVYGDLGLKAPKLLDQLPKKANATWNPISLEKLAELNADHIFLVNSDKSQGADTLNNPVWKNLRAVKAGHVYEMHSKSSWLYSGLTANEQMIDDVVKTLGK
ncbi:iron-hydroxamate ABC transporter substrate-binding protein [Camelliibacillus cellulosilyticus]|uniref:Iron-hydroxamate ABC transporter substrate-binding protein n=1 Tax=Camelliibacillus cellulosilyticus TaxID=2174486 RepID=A0ABV9GMT7_9BACL